MHLLQLNPPIPVSTPKGKGLAHLVIDYGCEHHLIWVCFIDATGECWSFPNPEIRAQSNPTMGRRAKPRGERCECYEAGGIENTCAACLNDRMKNPKTDYTPYYKYFEDRYKSAREGGI